MTKIIKHICGAFLEKRAASLHNNRTDGQKLWLHDHLIAEWRGEEIWITTAGQFHKATKERLNALGARIYVTKTGHWMIPTDPDKPKVVGTVWNGSWIKLDSIVQNKGTRHVSLRRKINR
jgi:hypothetical protein